MAVYVLHRPFTVDGKKRFIVTDETFVAISEFVRRRLVFCGHRPLYEGAHGVPQILSGLRTGPE